VFPPTFDGVSNLLHGRTHQLLLYIMIAHYFRPLEILPTVFFALYSCLWTSPPDPSILPNPPPEPPLLPSDSPRALAFHLFFLFCPSVESRWLDSTAHRGAELIHICLVAPSPAVTHANLFFLPRHKVQYSTNGCCSFLPTHFTHPLPLRHPPSLVSSIVLM